ncbi:MAG: hypothetical protein HYZ45_06345 [Burkholderiales bacterium]|nr:hypothetical protein [Burkholderiales bacterium]
MKKQIGNFAFLVAIAIALFGAVIHWVSPWMGFEWLEFWHVPRSAVAAARAGDMSVMWIGVGIGVLMFLCALYGLSGAGKIRRIPLTALALPIISAICLVRGALILPIWLLYPQIVRTYDVVASLVWAIAGAGFLLGTVLNWAQIRRKKHE